MVPLARGACSTVCSQAKKRFESGSHYL